MIRYVVAVLLMTALLGLGLIAVEEVSAVRGETTVESAIATVERAATSLMANDDPVPDAAQPPRRVRDVDFPTGGFASQGVETLVFEPVAGANRTLVRYRVEGRSAETAHLDAPLVNAAAGTATVDLSGSAGSRTVVLELVRDGDGRSVVQVTVR